MSKLERPDVTPGVGVSHSKTVNPDGSEVSKSNAWIDKGPMGLILVGVIIGLVVGFFLCAKFM